MFSSSDQRITVGATVFTSARIMLHIKDYRRIYGPRFKTEEVSGTVVSVQDTQKSKRCVTFIEADWTVAGTIKRISVSLANVSQTLSVTVSAAGAAPPVPPASVPVTESKTNQSTVTPNSALQSRDDVRTVTIGTTKIMRGILLFNQPRLHTGVTGFSKRSRHD